MIPIIFFYFHLQVGHNLIENSTTLIVIKGTNVFEPSLLTGVATKYSFVKTQTMGPSLKMPK